MNYRLWLYLPLAVWLVYCAFQPRVGGRTASQWANHLSDESTASDKTLAIRHLRALGSAAVPKMIEILEDEDSYESWPEAISVLAHCGEDASIATPVLLEALQREVTPEFIARQLETMDTKFELARIAGELASDGDPAVSDAFSYVEQLSQTVVVQHIHDRFSATRHNAALALTRVAEPTERIEAALVFAVLSRGNVGAVVSLGRMGRTSRAVTDTLIKVLDGEVREEDTPLTLFNLVFGAGQESMRIHAIRALGQLQIDDADAVNRLERLLDRGNLEAALALARIGSKTAHVFDKLESRARDGDPYSAIALAHEGRGDRWLVDVLYRILAEEHFPREAVLFEAIGDLGVQDERFVNLLLEASVREYLLLGFEPRRNSSNAALYALANCTSDPKYLDQLVRRLAPPAPNAALDSGLLQHEQAVEYLGRLGHLAAGALPRLRVIARNPTLAAFCDNSIQQKALEAIKLIESDRESTE